MSNHSRQDAEGSKAIETEHAARMNLIMSKTPKERYHYLANNGWVRLSMERKEIKGQTLIVIQWKAPDTMVFPSWVKGRVFKQTQAIREQVFEDMVNEGFCQR